MFKRMATVDEELLASSMPLDLIVRDAIRKQEFQRLHSFTNYIDRNFAETYQFKRDHIMVVPGSPRWRRNIGARVRQNVSEGVKQPREFHMPFQLLPVPQGVGKKKLMAAKAALALGGAGDGPTRASAGGLLAGGLASPALLPRALLAGGLGLAGGATPKDKDGKKIFFADEVEERTVEVEEEGVVPEERGVAGQVTPHVCRHTRILVMLENMVSSCFLSLHMCRVVGPFVVVVFAGIRVWWSMTVVFE